MKVSLLNEIEKSFPGKGLFMEGYEFNKSEGLKRGK
jgi:hypothetical protein